MKNNLLNSIPRIRRGFRLQFEPSQNAYVLLYPEGMVQLNESAASILKQVNGYDNVGEIISNLEQQYPQAQDIKADVLAFLEVAYAKFLIQNS